MNNNFYSNINLTNKGEIMDNKLDKTKKEIFKELIIKYLLTQITEKQS
jgi:hypothetical protein